MTFHKQIGNVSEVREIHTWNIATFSLIALPVCSSIISVMYSNFTDEEKCVYIYKYIHILYVYTIHIIMYVIHIYI